MVLLRAGDWTAYILDKAAGNLVVAQLPLDGLAPDLNATGPRRRVHNLTTGPNDW